MAFQSVLATATPSPAFAAPADAPARAPLAAPTPGAPYDYTVVAKSGDAIGPGTLTTLGRSPSINNLGTVALVGKHIHGEELIVAEVNAQARNINPGFSNTTSRHFDESVQINDAGQVLAKDRGPTTSSMQATPPAQRRGTQFRFRIASATSIGHGSPFIPTRR
jgi:hypothetical protein